MQLRIFRRFADFHASRQRRPQHHNSFAMGSSSRYFHNPYPDYSAGDEKFGEPFIKQIRQKIHDYTDLIVQKTWTSVGGMQATNQRSDLYVGDAGIAYMFLRLQTCNALHANDFDEAGVATGDDSSHSVASSAAAAAAPLRNYQLQASNYAKRALSAIATRRHQRPPKPEATCEFLCGQAGVHAIVAVMAHRQQNAAQHQSALQAFAAGIDGCEASQWDEMLVGRAGFVSGVHWLNAELQQAAAAAEAAPFPADVWSPLCVQMLESGRRMAKSLAGDGFAGPPLRYQYHETEYLGAAHGLAGILQVMLTQPAWLADVDDRAAKHVWDSVDWLVGVQDAAGDFPTALDSEQRGDRRLMHWCHGAAGTLMLLLQAHRLRPADGRYLQAARLAADAVWQRGLLRKGPGICHGVGGNGLAQLVMYRCTGEPRYLYRASRFALFLETEEFRRGARQPDRPFSLYEGVAGTVCFLCDLLEPERAAFPFLEVV